jgi:hypothetical protein
MALKIRAAGEDFAATARQLANNIADAEDGEPWGDDKHGQAFYHNYSGQPEDGSPLPDGVPFANVALRKSLHDAGETLTNLGTKAVEGMMKYTMTEATNAADISSAVEPT